MKQLKWYGQIQRINKDRLPKQLMTGKKRKIRIKTIRMGTICGMMREIGPTEEGWRQNRANSKLCRKM